MDREPIFNVPVAITLSTGLLIAIHGFRSLLPEELDLWFLLALSVIPARYSGTELELPGGDLSAVFSPITYMFLHGDLTHLFVNCVWLLAFGSAVAVRIGTVPFLYFSALCGLGGIAAHLVFHWGELVPVLGASAAISGQMAGAMRFFFGAQKGGNILDIRENPRAVPRISIVEALKEPKFLMFFAIWVALNILFGLGAVGTGGDDSIAWEAHIGGFLTGLLTFQIFDKVNPAPPTPIRDLNDT